MKLRRKSEKGFLNGAAMGHMSKEFLQGHRNKQMTPEQEIKILQQEVSMRYVISKLSEQQKQNPLEYLLQTKERDFAQQKVPPENNAENT